MDSNTVLLYNIRVNSKTRLKRLSLHLASICPLSLPPSTPILINVRGIFKKSAENLFRLYFKDPILFNLNNDRGWKNDTIYMLSQLTRQWSYVVWMLEDSSLIYQRGLDLVAILQDAARYQVEFLPLSQFKSSLIFGSDKSAKKVPISNTIDFYCDTEFIDEIAFQTRSKLLRNNWETYPIWAFGIYSQRLFAALLARADNDDQFYTPFGMEVPPPVSSYPSRIGFLTDQLFVTFDDDQGFTGDSLLSRGLYNDAINQTLLRMQEDYIDSINCMPTIRNTR